MKFLMVFAVIMEILMVAMCAIYARNKKIGHNNLFTMLMLSIGAIALATLTAIYPSWWMVAIVSYALLGVWYYLNRDYNKVEKWLRNDFRNDKIRKILRNSSEWLCMIILVAISVTVLVKCWAWDVGLVFIPIGALALYITLSKLRSVLNDI